ncbi:MAG: hypothetical protein SFT93_00645 [Rickettsiaceae bacterium]|nr:hypothetical protein [Rickettsiaceae bacterium]
MTNKKIKYYSFFILTTLFLLSVPAAAQGIAVGFSAHAALVKSPLPVDGQ